jgi:hypothetical protein
MGLFDCWSVAVPNRHFAWFLPVVPMKRAYDFAIRGLTALGMFAATMFMLGYFYASIPLVKVKTCTPSITDRIFK